MMHFNYRDMPRQMSLRCDARVPQFRLTLGVLQITALVSVISTASCGGGNSSAESGGRDASGGAGRASASSGKGGAGGMHGGVGGSGTAASVTSSRVAEGGSRSSGTKPTTSLGGAPVSSGTSGAGLTSASAGAGGRTDGTTVGGQLGTGGAPGPAPVVCTFTDASTPTSITLDGDQIQAANLNGLTFKGFGVLSANGTSELLMDYKSEQPEKYAEFLRIFFGGPNPVITHVKIEMGNDRNNSTGPDPATMRSPTEAANVRRSAGFQLAADAKKLNPALKVSLLRWNAPGWADDNDKIYAWYKATILAAYRDYGYMIDYVNPGLNEHAADLVWTKQYADRVKSDSTGFTNATEQALYNAIKIVISDEVDIGSFG